MKKRQSQGQPLQSMDRQTTSQVSDGEYFCKADSIQKHPVPRAEAMMKSTQSTTKHLAVQQTEKTGVLALGQLAHH